MLSHVTNNALFNHSFYRLNLKCHQGRVALRSNNNCFSLETIESVLVIYEKKYTFHFHS